MFRFVALCLMLTLFYDPTAHGRTRTIEHTTAAPAAQRTFGLGAVLGDPTAITGKYWLNSDRALDFGLAFFENNYFLVYGDYLFHFAGLFGRRTRFVSELSPYVGVGGLLASFRGDYYRSGKNYWRSENRADFGLGIRVPFGIEWRPTAVPIGAFVELVPGMALIPGTDLFIQFGVGARYYF